MDFSGWSLSCYILFILVLSFNMLKKNILLKF